jgi:hypothetical protein
MNKVWGACLFSTSTSERALPEGVVVLRVSLALWLSYLKLRCRLSFCSPPECGVETDCCVFLLQLKRGACSARTRPPLAAEPTTSAHHGKEGDSGLALRLTEAKG